MKLIKNNTFCYLSKDDFDHHQAENDKKSQIKFVLLKKTLLKKS